VEQQYQKQQQKHPNSQSNLEQKGHTRRHYTVNLKTILFSYNNQNSMVLV
jgi:hypothetical protein